MKSQARKTCFMKNPAECVAETIDGRIDLFGHEGQAQMYKEFRPVYPERLITAVVSGVPEYSRNLYVDVACGSGQLTALIAPAFTTSKGFDQSLEQLSHAEKPEGCTLIYQAGSAFALPLESNSVDLLTVAQGLHWLLPYDKFFTEVNRVLKVGGVFTTVAYGFPQLLHADANAHVQHFYRHTLGATLSPGQAGCWWETNRPTIDAYYADISFPYSTTLSKYSELVVMSVDHFFNYLRTLSAYRTMLRAGVPDPLIAVEAAVRSALPSNKLKVEIPFFTVSYRKC